MVKRLFLLLVAVLSMQLSMAKSGIYTYKVADGSGKQVSLKEYKGKVLLIVNTATQCGFTPQYKELEALYEELRDKGFVILDFPCNQFGEQAPGSLAEIRQFCTEHFDTQFPQFDKIEVNGSGEHPLYTYLKAQQGFKGFGTDGRAQSMDKMLRRRDADYDKKSDIKWNFTKFLVNKKGKVVQRFEPTQSMEEVRAAVLRLLK